ncbi:hypothetical protein SUGI_0237220 [Cryptomeria japonica]|nr:hypothetical protein SUGI_0237220 [Cryptomeria japonica]
MFDHSAGLLRVGPRFGSFLARTLFKIAPERMIFPDVDASGILSAVMSSSRNGALMEVPYRREELGQKNQRYISDYFTVESALLLFWLTASVLFLPLILPPLPPPPFILLLLPIVILVVLMVLAFMPCNVISTVRQA